MYEEYLGEGYHDVIRKMLTADEKLCPNTMIDADLNIGAMKMLIGQALKYKTIDKTELTFQIMQKAARYYLASLLCVAIQSRIKSPPFHLAKYKKNWQKKQRKFNQKGYDAMKLLTGR